MQEPERGQALGGAQVWSHASFVSVPGELGAGRVEKKWRTTAVFKVTPTDIRFHILFKQDTNGRHLCIPIELFEGYFRMRLGPVPLEFYAIPFDLEAEVAVSLVGVTVDTDPAYRRLPIYWQPYQHPEGEGT